MLAEGGGGVPQEPNWVVLLKTGSERIFLLEEPGSHTVRTGDTVKGSVGLQL